MHHDDKPAQSSDKRKSPHKDQSVFMPVCRYHWRENSTNVNDFSAHLGQLAKDPIHFSQSYEFLIRLMNAIPHLC